MAERYRLRADIGFQANTRASRQEPNQVLNADNIAIRAAQYEAGSNINETWFIQVYWYEKEI